MGLTDSVVPVPPHEDVAAVIHPEQYLALQVRRETFSREGAFAHAMIMCREMATQNSLKFPTFRYGPIRGSYGWASEGRGKSYLIQISDRCSYPCPVKGRAWSWPGYKSDLTPHGVTCHEFGHVVDYQLKVTNSRTRWATLVGNEDRVTSYGPNAAECFAEAFKLFMTNPELLRAGRPRTFEFITEKLGIRPLHAVPAMSVLEHSPDRVKKAARNWGKISAQSCLLL